jgi:hypothetical protein
MAMPEVQQTDTDLVIHEYKTVIKICMIYLQN